MACMIYGSVCSDIEAASNEVWLPISNQHPGLEASSSGLIRRRFKNGTIRNVLGIVCPRGYLRTQVSYGGRCRWVRLHVLVARAFLGTCPPGREVNHKDGVKKNNAPDNLEYVTHQDNIRHAWASGLKT